MFICWLPQEDSDRKVYCRTVSYIGILAARFYNRRRCLCKSVYTAEGKLGYIKPHLNVLIFFSSKNVRTFLIR